MSVARPPRLHLDRPGAAVVRRGGPAALRQAHRRADRRLDRQPAARARVRRVAGDVLRACSTSRTRRGSTSSPSSPGCPPGSCRSTWASYADPLSVTWILLVTGVGVADPPLFDRLHARRRALRALLRLPEPVRRRRCSMLVLGSQLPRHLPRLGGRRSLLVPADLVLVRAQRRGGRGQEGVRHQPRRRRRVPARDVPDLRRVRLARTTPADARRGAARDLDAAPRPRSRCCCSSARWARARRSRCTSGCPTRWRARPRCRRSSTRPRWSPPACSCCAARTRSSR